MKKLLLASCFLFILAGCGHKTQPTTEKPVEEVKKEVSNKNIEQKNKEITSSSTYKNENFGFQITMPKEWSDYIVFQVPNNEQSISDITIEFYLPTNDKNFSSIEKDYKNYTSVMKLLIWDLNNWNNLSKDCSGVPSMDENGVCIYKERIIAKNNSFVFIIVSGQDYPDDLRKEAERIGLDFPNNFKKYFDFKLIK